MCVSVCACRCACCVCVLCVRVVCACVDSKRLRVCRQNARVTFDTGILAARTETFSIYTRRRFESTHAHIQETNNRETDGHRQTTLFSSSSFFTCLSVSLVIYISLHMSLSLLIRLAFSLALSARLSFFLFSITMTMLAGPVGSLCTQGSDLP